MMFFGRALKCGGLGASGFGSAELGTRSAESSAMSCSFNNEPRAIEPRPKAHWLKKWRRVIARKMSCLCFIEQKHQFPKPKTQRNPKLQIANERALLKFAI